MRFVKQNWIWLVIMLICLTAIGNEVLGRPIDPELIRTIVKWMVLAFIVGFVVLLAISKWW